MGLKEIFRKTGEKLKKFDASVPADQVDIMWRQIGEETTQIRQRRANGVPDFSTSDVEPLLKKVNESGCFGDDSARYKQGNLIIGTRYVPVGDVRCIGHLISEEIADRNSRKKQN